MEKSKVIFFSFNVIFVIWPIKFPLKFEFLVWGFLSCLSKTEGSFLRDFWIMFHTHSKPNYELRLFFPYKNYRIEYYVMWKFTNSVQILTSLHDSKKNSIQMINKWRISLVWGNMVCQKRKLIFPSFQKQRWDRIWNIIKVL